MLGAFPTIPELRTDHLTTRPAYSATPASLFFSRLPRDTHMALDWLGWPAASRTVRRKVKRSHSGTHALWCYGDRICSFVCLADGTIPLFVDGPELS